MIYRFVVYFCELNFFLFYISPFLHSTNIFCWPNVLIGCWCIACNKLSRYLTCVQGSYMKKKMSLVAFYFNVIRIYCFSLCYVLTFFSFTVKCFFYLVTLTLTLLLKLLLFLVGQIQIKKFRFFRFSFKRFKIILFYIMFYFMIFVKLSFIIILISTFTYFNRIFSSLT